MLAKAGLSKACKKALLAMIDKIHSQSTLFSKKFITLFQRHKFIVLFQCCKFFDISQGFATQKAEFRSNFSSKIKQNSAVLAQIFVDFFDFFDNLGDYPLRRASPSAHTAMLFAHEPLRL